jgi:hypothetical protein
MGPKEFISGVCKIMFPKKEKIVEKPGVIGHYDSKPYHNFRYALIYANETLVFNNEKVEIFSRIYKDTTFVNILVNEEEGFEISNYTFDKVWPLLEGKTYLRKDKEEQFKQTKNNIVLVLFQHYNDYTVAQAKKFHNSTKNNFEHAVIFNPVNVQMDFYKPVPKFYRLYDHFCEDIYFDLAFIDDTRD